MQEQPESLKQTTKISKQEKIAFYTEAYAAVYERAGAYTSLIIGVGYVGFFTAWDKMKDLMCPKLYAASGLFIALSLLCFMIWEVCRMIFMARMMNQNLVNVNLAAESDEFEEAMARFREGRKQANLKLIKIWPWMLYSTLGFAFIATVLLLVGFISYLFC